MQSIMSNVITVCISTIYKKIYSIDFNNYPIVSGVDYCFSCQVETPCQQDEIAKTPPIQRKDIFITTLIGSGLSRNRNHSLSHANGDIVVIADDDVKYMPNYFDEIKKVFEVGDLDFATFKIKCSDSLREYKNYKSTPFNHNYFSVRRVSSIEIAIRRTSLIDSQVTFDSRFGLGSGCFTKSEEAIFLRDLQVKGLKGRYFPSYIVLHPFESSGKKFGYNLTEYNQVSAKLYRMYGHYGKVIMFFVVIKNITSFFRLGPRNVLNAIIKGFKLEPINI